MSYVIAAPEMTAAAATDLAGIRFDAERGPHDGGAPDRCGHSRRRR